MACGCRVRYQRVYPATIAVRLSQDPKATPVAWNEDRLVICTACGVFSGRVQDPELLELREGSGQPIE